MRYVQYLRIGGGGSGNTVDRQPQKFALRGDSIGVGEGGGGLRVCMASYGLWATISYPNAPVPFTPLPQKYFSLQPYVQEYKIYTVLRIRDVYHRSRILIFTHPGSQIQKQQQKRGMKKNMM
jgi:hypothetical protein